MLYLELQSTIASLDEGACGCIASSTVLTGEVLFKTGCDGSALDMLESDSLCERNSEDPAGSEGVPVKRSKMPCGRGSDFSITFLPSHASKSIMLPPSLWIGMLLRRYFTRYYRQVCCRVSRSGERQKHCRAGQERHQRTVRTFLESGCAIPDYSE